MVKLLKAAQIKGGKISVTHGVMATGASFAEVEAVLKQMLKSGYVSINNDPDTGTVLYHFHELWMRFVNSTPATSERSAVG